VGASKRASGWGASTRAEYGAGIGVGLIDVSGIGHGVSLE
jgi:hypothetical protein